MKILVVQIGKIGDTVLTTPLLHALSEGLPGARIDVLASHRGIAVLEGCPFVHRVILYRKNPLGLARALAAMRLGRYDMLIDPKDHFSRESALLARLCGARRSVGFNPPNRATFTHAIPSQDENYNLHAVDRNCAALRYLGIAHPASPRPRLIPDPELSKTVRDRFGPWDAKTMLLNVSAGDDCRLWTEEKWSEIAAWCIKRGLRVLVSFQPSHESIAQGIQRRNPAAALFYSSSIKEVIALLPSVSWVVTPDTAIVHIASAFNIPQVALFPPVAWNTLKFRPLSDVSVVVQPKEGEAVATIPVEEVIHAVERIMDAAC